jgi:hypothetical protein
MATAKYGLFPIGPQNPDAIQEFIVDPDNTSALYIGDIAISVASEGVAQHTATATNNVGVVVGLIDANGLHANYAPAAAASKAGYKALVNTDPHQTYMMHWYHATTSLAATDVLSCADVVVGTGNTTTGLSGSYITAVGTGTATVMILGLTPIQGNAWGSDCEVTVKLHENVFHAATQHDGV